MSWRTFSVGMAIVAVLFVALFAGIQAANRGTHRPEGIAERWLAAISDTTRKGVRDDAVRRAGKEGPETVGEPLTSADARKDGKRSFRDLEVGKATVAGAAARVPFLLHQYASSGPSPQRTGAVLLQRSRDSWRIVALGPRQAGERVPSEGGDPPSQAPASYWVVAFLIGIGVTAVASGLINLAGRAARPRPTAAARA